MSYFTSRFPYFLSAVVGVVSGVYIFQPALEDIARISRENEAKYRMEQMDKSIAAAANAPDSSASAETTTATTVPAAEATPASQAAPSAEQRSPSSA